jgi:hypothetical protein
MAESARLSAEAVYPKVHTESKPNKLRRSDIYFVSDFLMNFSRLVVFVCTYRRHTFVIFVYPRTKT